VGSGLGAGWHRRAIFSDSVYFVALLAEVHTLENDEGMRERKEMLWIRIPYLICIPRVKSCCVAGLLGLLH
jgi:hypothetical protein